MTTDRINRDELADKLVERAAEAEDPLRTMAELITEFLMEAEVAHKVGAEAHERSEQRTTHRNRYRDRRWDTRLVLGVHLDDCTSANAGESSAPYPIRVGSNFLHQLQAHEANIRDSGPCGPEN